MLYPAELVAAGNSWQEQSRTLLDKIQTLLLSEVFQRQVQYAKEITKS